MATGFASIRAKTGRRDRRLLKYWDGSRVEAEEADGYALPAAGTAAAVLPLDFLK